LQHEDFLLALQVNEDEYKKVGATNTSATLMWPAAVTLHVVFALRKTGLVALPFD